MPSIDEDLLLRLYQSGKLVCFADQNNGYILHRFLKVLYRHPESARSGALGQILSINTLDRNGNAQFIHSGTYEELTAGFGLTPAQIAQTLRVRLAEAGAGVQ